MNNINAEKRNKDFVFKSSQEQAMPIHRSIIYFAGFISSLCVLGGIFAIIYNSTSTTEFSIFGATLSTGHVGVAFVGIGIIIGYFITKQVLKSQLDLAKLQKDR